MSEHLLYLVQQLLNGLTIGSTYALIAIGYTMVYGIIGMINFAHGEIYMIGAYAGLVTLAAVGTQSGLPVAVLIALMLLVAVLVTGTYGFVVEQIAYKPLRNGPRLVALISAIGMSIFLQNWVALGQGARDMAVPALLPGALRFGDEGGFEIFVPYARVLIIAVTVVLMIVTALADVGIRARYVPLNDIASDKGKIAGAAQKRFAAGSVLHHVTMAYDIDADKMLEVLRIGREKMSDKGTKSANKRVDPMRSQTGLPRDEIIARFLASFRAGHATREASYTDDELAAARELMDAKFLTDAWTHRVP